MTPQEAIDAMCRHGSMTSHEVSGVIRGLVAQVDAMVSTDEVLVALGEAFARSGTRTSRDTVIYKNFKDILSARHVERSKVKTVEVHDVGSDMGAYTPGRA